MLFFALCDAILVQEDRVKDLLGDYLIHSTETEAKPTESRKLQTLLRFSQFQFDVAHDLGRLVRSQDLA